MAQVESRLGGSRIPAFFSNPNVERWFVLRSATGHTSCTQCAGD
jgi:hypothetical protein